MQSPLPNVLRYATLASALALACCAPPPPPPVVSAPAPVPTPTPAPPPVVQEPVYENFLDAPQTPGDWQYRTGTANTMAVFVEADGRESFAMVCSGGELTLSRAGQAGSAVPMRIRTETAQQLFNAEPASNGASVLNVQMRSRNPILDAIALSRGRFAVETAGLRTLYLPAWAEVTRVIEDCR